MEIDIKQVQKIETEMLREIVLILKTHHVNYFLAFGSALGAVRHNGPIPWDHDVDLFIWLDDVDSVVDLLRNNLSDRFIVDYDREKGTHLTMFPRVCLAHTVSDTIHIDLFLLYGLVDCQKKRRRQYKQLTTLHKILAHYKNRSHFVRNNALFKFCAKLEEFLFLPITNKWLKMKYFKIAQKYNNENSEYVGYVGMGKGDAFFRRSLFGTGENSHYDGIIVSLPDQYDEYLQECYGDYMQYPSFEERKRGLSFKTTISDEDYEAILN